ncbi:MAG: hypothetical protein JNL66_20845 [Alphaproteobacteria bacterium]|nr:hypothetical protein [Alphaproteobacteria bacterium]
MVTAMPAPSRYDLPAYEPRRWQGGGEAPPHRFVGQLPGGTWVAMTEFNRRNEAAQRWQRTVRVIAQAVRRDFALPVEPAAAVTAQVLGDGTMLIAETIGRAMRKHGCCAGRRFRRAATTASWSFHPPSSSHLRHSRPSSWRASSVRSRPAAICGFTWACGPARASADRPR